MLFSIYHERDELKRVSKCVLKTFLNILRYACVLVKQTMAWILDEYSKFHGYSPAVVTGKPVVSILNSSL
jgi:hypothetical protein